MLELRTYTYKEMSAMFGTRDTQGIKRRLTRYGIEYTVEGRGASARFNIDRISDPFNHAFHGEKHEDGFGFGIG